MENVSRQEWNGYYTVIMKTAVALTLTLAALTHASFGNLTIPRSVFKMADLEAAKTKATESEKPLIFVYTDPGST
mgnify:FL=1